MVDRTGLENRQPARAPGFESLLLRQHMRTAAGLVLILALAATLSSGCKAAGSKPKPSARARLSPSVLEPVGLRMMPFAKRMATLPEGMPSQIPVMDGAVTDTSAPVSDSSWLYTLETSGSVESVSHWYAKAYQAAGWHSAAYAQFEGKALTLRLRKNQAETVLRIAPSGSGRVRVEASIGLGRRAPAVY